MENFTESIQTMSELDAKKRLIPLSRNRYKMLVTGSKNAGKSCFIKRVFNDDFVENEKIDWKMHESVSLSHKNLNYIIELQEVDYNVFEANNEDENIDKIDWLDVHSVLLIYSSTDLNSFMELQKMLRIIQRKVALYCHIILVGCKAEVVAKSVPFEVIDVFADQNAMTIIECSAKERKNTFDVIYTAIDHLEYEKFCEPEIDQPVYRDTVEPIHNQEEHESVFNAFCWLPRIGSLFGRT